ncbi:MAG: glycosyltransferase family 4 protein [Caldilineaceae bacterium]|nr:glycosyltransferase family 4 protein [Caldilineaceae bacterium]
MRIGIDARFLTHPQPGGFKTYTQSLLSALGALDTGDDYVVYLDRTPTADTVLPACPHFHYRVVPGTFPVAGMPWREQIGLRRHLARDGVQLVHFPCNTATVGLALPYVVTLHDTIQLTTPTSVGRSPGQWKHWAITTYSKQSVVHAARGAACLLTVSECVREDIHATLGIPRERIAVTYQGPNPRFVPVDATRREAWGADLATRLDVRGPYILGVGYEARKNMPLLIDAFAQLAATVPDMMLVIVAAEAEVRNRLWKQAVARGLGQRARILGRLPFEDLLRLYSLAALFAFPSGREGYGLPPLEAMACGVPTLVMRASSLPEVVQDGALLVDGADAQVWAAAMGRLLADADLRASLRERGLARARQLTWQQCAEATAAVYRQVFRRAYAPDGMPPSVRPVVG